MQTYIMLIGYTDQGIRNVKGSPGRLDAAKALAKSLGGAIKEFYLTMGGFDIVCIIDMPDDATIARFALALGSLGNVRTQTLKAFSETEFRKIVANLP